MVEDAGVSVAEKLRSGVTVVELGWFSLMCEASDEKRSGEAVEESDNVGALDEPGSPEFLFCCPFWGRREKVFPSALIVMRLRRRDKGRFAEGVTGSSSVLYCDDRDRALTRELSVR